MKKLLALFLVLAPAVAGAQAFRVGSGIQIVPRATAPARVAANGRVWLKLSDSTLHYVNPAGTDIALGAGGGSAVYFSNADHAKAINQGGVPGVGAVNGNSSNGAIFSFSKAGTITGGRWYQPASLTASVTAKLWTMVGTVATQVAAVTISSPVAGDVNAFTFSSPVTIAPGTLYSMTVYDGVHELLCNSGVPGIAIGGGTYTGSTGSWGPGLWLYGFSFRGGDNGTFGNSTNYNGLEPTYTVP